MEKKVFLKKNIINKNKLQQAKKILKNLTNENSSEIIINNLNLLNVNPNNSDNKKQNYLNFLYFLFKSETSKFVLLHLQKKYYHYKEQLNKRLGINKKKYKKS